MSRDAIDRTGELCKYVNSGNNCSNLGSFENAVRCYSQALDIAERLENKIEKARARGNIGNANRSLGKFKEAIENHEQQLKIAKEAGDRTGEIDAYGNLGTDYFCLGDFQEAKEHHRTELYKAETSGDEWLIGKANSRLGTDYYCFNDFANGIKCHKKHLDIAETMGDEKEKGLAYGNIGVGYRKIGKFLDAKICHEEELKIAKLNRSMAEEANASLNLGSTYRDLCKFDDAKRYHQEGRDLAMKMSEKVVYGDALYELGRDFECQGSIDKAVENFEKSVKVYNEERGFLKGKDSWAISFRDSHQMAYTALWRSLLRLGKHVTALTAAEQGRAQALVDLLHLRHGIKESDQDRPKDETRSFTALLKISTQAVFFAIESNKIHFWVIRQGEEIHYRQLELDISTVLQLFLETAERHSSDALCNMYDLIIKPIRDLLDQAGDLIIVPDGQLFLVPYNALQQGKEQLKEETKYLFESFRIRIVPSLTCLKLISDPSKDDSSKSGVLLVGNPHHHGLPFLKQAKHEVKFIAKRLKLKTRNVTTLIGERATGEAVRANISSVTLIHIAAHGTPGTGEICLTGKDKLTMSGVPQVRARLVVLSCCDSGQGKITADGVVGIARAFLGAGARSVLMALWEVDDWNTTRIMREFYKRLVEGKRTSEALNETLEYCKEHFDVKYWAPFMLIGDDVTLEFDETE